MISQRLRQLRLARGLSLEALAALMGGIVTKQALSKYETGRAQPSMAVLTRLASALGVKSAYLWGEPTVAVKLGGYRKRAALPKREEERVESLVTEALEDRVRIQELTLQGSDGQLPIKKWAVGTLDEAEHAAETLRQDWSLGVDPIANLTAVLEAHLIHVIQLDGCEDFDGFSAFAEDEDGQRVAAAVISRLDVPGDRQRLNLAHELGHLVLEVSPDLDEEKAAYRFGSAFLAPAEMVRAVVGHKRAGIRLQELSLLKQYFGMSIAAILYRLRVLGIISETYYTLWCREISRRGWKKQEPYEVTREHPQWLRLNVLRALGEGQLLPEDATRILGEPVESEEPVSAVERRAFMRLPLEERRRIMSDQAARMARHYEEDTDWRELEADDVVEY